MVTLFALATGGIDRRMLGIDGFAGLGLGPMGLETGVPVEGTSTERTEHMSRTVVSVGLSVILTSFLQTGSAVIGFVVGTGMLTRMVVDLKTSTAKVIFPKETG